MSSKEEVKTAPELPDHLKDQSEAITEEGNIKPQVIFQNRADRRRKVKNRHYTKKGYTRAILINDDGIPHNIPTKKGSKIDGLAHHNSKKFKKQRSKDER